MDSFGLPMSFGKKSKAGPVNMKAKVETTKRNAEPAAPVEVKSEVKTELNGTNGNLQGEAGPSRSVSPGPKAPVSSTEDDDEDIGPVPPGPGITGVKRKADPSTEEEEDPDLQLSDEEPEPDRTPITHEIVLKDHTKTVSALAVDPSGSRIVSGGYDYDAKLWDFGGMDARLRPFKSWEPNGNYLVHDLDFSADGKRVLCVSGTFWPKVFNRDAEEDAV